MVNALPWQPEKPGYELSTFSIEFKFTKKLKAQFKFLIFNFSTSVIFSEFMLNSITFVQFRINSELNQSSINSIPIQRFSLFTLTFEFGKKIERSDFEFAALEVFENRHVHFFQ